MDERRDHRLYLLHNPRTGHSSTTVVKRFLMKHYLMRLADELMVEMCITYEQALEEAMKIMKGSNNGKQ